jgi:hypothetical protein
MKNKSLNFVIAGVLAFVFLISFASATLSFSNVPTLSQTGNSASITITSTENETVSFSLTSINSEGKPITFDSISNLNINDSASQTVTINYIVPSDFDFEFQKSYETTLTVTGTNSSANSQKIAFTKNTNICSINNIGDLKIDIRNIEVVEGIGDDDEWFPFDSVEIEVRVENDGSEDIDDIELEWGIYDGDNNRWVVEMDDVEDFDLRDGDDEAFIISFTLAERNLDVDLDELEDGTYTIYVRATGDVDNNNNDETCAGDSDSVEIIIERDFVILTDLEFSENLQCGSQVQFTGEIWNIGDRDQDDVEVRVVSTSLNLNEYVTIGDIDAFDKESFSLLFDIPSTINSGVYSISFHVLDEDGDVYEAKHDDETSSFSQSITIDGSCASSSKVTLSAVLQSGGQAGEELVIKATVANSGTSSSDYLLNVQGYSEWADSYSLSESSLTLGAGQSKEVLITLNVNKDAEGEKLFNIEVLSEDKLIATQPVSVSIEGKKGLGITGFAINSDNWHIWGIGLLNLILVIVIIIIAVRIARRK